MGELRVDVPGQHRVLRRGGGCLHLLPRQALAAVRSAADFEAFVDRFGVRRTSPRIWTTFDWIHADFREREPTRAGLFDLNRYGNF